MSASDIHRAPLLPRLPIQRGHTVLAWRLHFGSFAASAKLRNWYHVIRVQNLCPSLVYPRPWLHSCKCHLTQMQTFLPNPIPPLPPGLQLSIKLLFQIHFLIIRTQDAVCSHMTKNSFFLALIRGSTIFSTDDTSISHLKMLFLIFPTDTDPLESLAVSDG